MSECIYTKDPDAELDYSFDWETNWLAAGESISSHTITVQAGLTNEGDSEADGVVTVWLSGGTAGHTYEVSCLIETDSVPSRVDERSVTIICQER